MDEQQTIADLQHRLNSAERRSAEYEHAATASRESEAQYQALLAAAPVPFVVVAPNAPDFTIIGVNDAYVASTRSTREALIGRKLLDVFVYDPDHPGLQGSGLVARSLERVIDTRRTDVMERLRYDIPTVDGVLEPHWWLAVNAPVFDADGKVIALIHQATRITEQYRAEESARESEERQAFQLQLSDALASLADPTQIQEKASQLLAERLNVGWCYFNEFDDRGTRATVLGDFHRDGLPSMVGVHDLSEEQDFLDLVHSGSAFSFSDLEGFPYLSAPAAAAYRALGLCSALGVPLLRDGRLVAVLLAADTCSREWSRGDEDLLRGVMERTWAAIQRARAEAALRESEERFQQFARASAAGLWIRDATTLTMEFVSPAVTTIYGVEADTLLGDVKNWAP